MHIVKIKTSSASYHEPWMVVAALHAIPRVGERIRMRDHDGSERDWLVKDVTYELETDISAIVEVV